MKKITLLFFLLAFVTSFSQVQTGTFSVKPATFEENEEITVTVSGINASTWGVSDVYLWAWSFNQADLNQTPANAVDSPTNGTWTNSNEAQKMTKNGDGTFSFTFTPATFYGRTGLKRIGMLVKAKNGTGDKKTQDQLFDVGAFQLTLNTPTVATTLLNSGETIAISASTSLAADFNLKANGTSINTTTNSTSYSFTPTLTENTTFVLEATNSGTTETETFNVIVRPTVTEALVPPGLKDGINIKNNTVTLVFYAPTKDFVHVIGSFNNWSVDNNYLMKKDSGSDRFWIELSGLSSQTDHTYQYLINGELKVADPYSEVVLTSSNDQFIDATTYPNLPDYPTGKTNHHVTLLRFGDAAFNWQVTNFQKPKKTDLVIYKLLIRDFDALHSFDAVKARLDYLQDLGVNAIEFLPLNEFDGNESWGYNPSFHMALDKYYGSQTAFKELVDECHKRGIAVIVDVVFNHGSGQNPYYRMWNTDNGGYQGQATNDNPFFNAVAQHPFNVFNDMNHSTQSTQDYVKRISQFWIDEYKVDGFRYDLSKGFTQRFTTDVGVWNSYEADRIAILKKYADYQWEVDATSYVILEHFADNSEETELINYRLNEGKGMMVWGNFHGPYREAALGFHDGGKSNFDWISYKNRGWSAPQNVSYMVSHDEERHMYDAKLFGNSNGSYNIKTEATALDRMELNAAFFFTIPGPKMFWQFDELGYDISINQNGRTGNKPILWNYFNETDRKDVYDTWSKLIKLRLKYDVFETSDFSIDASNTNGLKKIHLTNANATDLQYVLILGNFGVTQQSITPFFQQTGTWYDLINDNTTINVLDTQDQISLAPGEFRVYGNMPAALSNEDFSLDFNKLTIYPNPTSSSFSLSKEVQKVSIFDLTGKQIKVFTKQTINSNSFNVSNLNTGIYFVKTKDNTNKIETKKLIIN